MLSHQQKGFIQEKERVSTQCMQMWQATCAHSGLRAEMEGYLYKRKRNGREGETRTTELYYKHRVLPVRFLGSHRVQEVLP